MNLYYLWNETRRERENAAGVDYTPAYFPALLAQLGASGHPCTPAEVSELTENDVLLANTDDLPDLAEGAYARILFCGGEVHREPGIVGHLLFGEERIPLFAPLRAGMPGGEVLYSGEDGEGQTVPAVVRQNDRFYEFRFDLCATVWFSGDGFSDGEPKNGFIIGRTPDTRPVPAGMYSDQPYNDHMLMILEDILLSLGVPILYRLPLTEEGTVPDFALHISGDDDHTSADFNLNGARVIHDLGLYYHVNAMPAGTSFIITPAQREEMAALGCELALHTNFWKRPYSLEVQQESVRIYRDYFGVDPVTNVNHCLIQGGMAAPRLRWLAESGIIADNSKLGEINPANINAFNLCGFGFGTSFPRYTCDDAEHGNALISCMEIPLNYYEPRLGGTYTDPDQILQYIDGAAKDGRIAQFFIHPHYLAPSNPNTAWSTAAVKLAKEHWTEKGYTVCLTSTNRIALFWQARRNAAICAVPEGITVECTVPTALVLPEAAERVLVDGKECATVTRKVTGRTRTLAVLAQPGTHRIEYIR